MQVHHARLAAAVVAAATLAGPLQAQGQPAGEGAPAAEPVPVAPGEPPPAAPPAATPAAPPPAMPAAFTLRRGAYELRLVGRLQAYFLGTSTAGAGGRVSRGLFELHRARLGLEGQAGARVRTKIQVELGKGNVHLKDFRFDVALAGGVTLRVGQWKRPFSRQFVTSSFRLELVERAITDRAFGNSRDIGVAIGNDYEASPPVEWTIGVFDGLEDEKPTVRGGVEVDPATGEGEVVDGTLSNLPAAFKPVVAARVGINHGPVKGYGEGDLEGGPLRWGLAAAAVLEGDADRDGAAAHRFTADAIAKLEGWSLGVAAFVSTRGTGLADAWDADVYGGHVQLGRVLARRMGLAVRVAAVEPAGGSAAARAREGAGAVSYHLGSAAKLQLDVATRTTAGSAPADHLRLQAQAQLAF